MIIGHIPAGYLWSKFLVDKTPVRHNKTVSQCLLFWTGMLGSVFPDIDMVYFYTIDSRQHLHHTYFTHLPLFWFIVLICIALYSLVVKKKEYLLYALVFFSNVYLHLILDTLAGGINWLYPFSQELFSFWKVPVRSSWWVYNFVFYWTSTIEALLFLAALMVFNKSSQKLRQYI